ncbi:MAG TPA: hypothetical protein VLC28_12220 [Flavitalea sp.]|nr:hypothetical protein [Flavitalea sp.]
MKVNAAKNHLYLAHYLVLACILVIFYGCKKCDLPGGHEPSCRIISINEEAGAEQVFHYTSWGDPEFIDIANEGTGRPDLYFKYDDHRRLIELQARYSQENNFEWIKRYYYEGEKVVRDSTFIFPAPDNFYFYAFEEGIYSYDNYNRIIQYSYVRYQTDMDTGSYSEEASETVNFDYPPEDPYIGNRNYLAGNRVLMFVNKYYHKTTPADAYNDLGYPTKFNENTPHLLDYNVMDIQYDCTGTKKSK